MPDRRWRPSRGDTSGRPRGLPAPVHVDVVIRRAAHLSRSLLAAARAGERHSKRTLGSRRSSAATSARLRLRLSSGRASHPATRTSAPRPDPDAAPRTKAAAYPAARPSARHPATAARGRRADATAANSSDATRLTAAALHALLDGRSRPIVVGAPFTHRLLQERLCVAHAEHGQHQEKLRLTVTSTIGPPRSATASAGLTVHEIVQ